MDEKQLKLKLIRLIDDENHSLLQPECQLLFFWYFVESVNEAALVSNHINQLSLACEYCRFDTRKKINQPLFCLFIYLNLHQLLPT